MSSSLCIFVTVWLCAAIMTTFSAPLVDSGATVVSEPDVSETTTPNTDVDDSEYDDTDFAQSQPAENPNDSYASSKQSTNDIQTQFNAKKFAEKWNLQNPNVKSSTDDSEKQKTLSMRSSQPSQQYQLGEPEYIPDLPVFDRTILLRLREQKLAAQNARS
ncbi:uncharacterized protein LOC129602826 [Paramacrobiotus metropolitanus]|uniref:uncharacterized protein LOC129602826 n=1 Tax=Paramacrobiotus metropolitanus TaxID=2943436 RepID=UPI002445BE06|nr:uncharacterized protein LOC129602826 [Paramacrobiotus metropolitanus]